MEPTATPRNIAPFSIVGVCAALAFFLLPLPQVLASLRPVPQHSPIDSGDLVITLADPHPIPSPKIADQACTVKPASPAHSELAPIAPRAAVPHVPAIPGLLAPAAVRQQILLSMAAPEAFARPFAASMAAIASGSEAWPQLRIAGLRAQAQAATPAAKPAPATTPRSDYIDQMRAAGYDVGLDQYIAMKVQGVTPEFAKSMAQIGFGKPTEQQLLALKIHGVTPEYVSQLNASGIKLADFQEVISYRIFNVSPEFIASMKTAGYGDLPAQKLIQLRIQGVTPEFAKATKLQFPDVSIDELVRLKIFHIDDAFVAKAKQLGLNPLTIDKLVKLRISGLIEDQAYDHHDSAEREQERSARQQQRELEREKQQKDKEKRQGQD